jgi:hypothetical protein
LKVIRTLVSLKTPSVSCKNPKNEILQKNCGTLETLAPKIQNSRNCNLKVVGGALKEVLHSYAKFSPNISVEGAKTTQKGEGRTFSGNPGRVVQIVEKRTDVFESLCNGYFKSYAPIPC